MLVSERLMSTVSAYIELLPVQRIDFVDYFFDGQPDSTWCFGDKWKEELGRRLHDWERAPCWGLGVPERSDLSPHPSVEAVHLALR